MELQFNITFENEPTEQTMNNFYKIFEQLISKKAIIIKDTSKNFST